MLSRWRFLYPWIVWILGAAFFFYKYLLQVSPSVMSTELMRDFNITGAGLGNLAACFFYTYLVMQLPVGLLLDRFSPRLITGLAVFICALGAFLFAHATSLGLAGISRALIGMGAAFAAVSCFKLATLWFPPHRFALIAGLSMTVAMLGAVGGEGPLSYLVDHFGWRSTMLWVSFPGFILMLLIFAVIRDKEAPAVATEAAKSVDYKMLWQQMKTILHSKQTWLLSWYSGLAFAPVSVFGGLWGVSFLKTAHHLSHVTAASVISFIFIGFAIGCPISGWLSDYMGRRKIIMAIGTWVALISILIVLYAPVLSSAFLYALLLLFGLGASCFFLCFSMIREIHPLIFAATVLGFMNTFDSLCEAVSEPFIGKLLDMRWQGTLDQGARAFALGDYHWALAVLPIYLGIAIFLLFFIEETFCMQK